MVINSMFDFEDKEFLTEFHFHAARTALKD